MELTQRLEFTQELYSDNCGKPCPEQIGFLGICGTKYPLKKGPNKLGRDPQTCNIVLNLNSISRQHAVINIPNNRDFMLMDLDSANKTKLADKILEPYIPHPLKNGDMVQFGEVFGVFRLLEEENDLPMTQAMDIPDTPVHHRHISKVNIHATTIPESPEVSDKEDSFIAVSQQKTKNVFKSPNNNFLKSTCKTTAKTVNMNKEDNVYWNSSKKTDSFSYKSNISHNLDDSVVSLRRSDIKSIHDMDTQMPSEEITKQIHELDTQIPNESLTKGIHELDTQVPNVPTDDCVDSIYNAATQIVEHSPDIYESETQVPTTEKLPEVIKIDNQKNLHINFSTDNKENDIYNAKSQVPLNEKLILQKENIFNTGIQVKDDAKAISPNSNENVIKSKSTSTSNVSDDIILFDEIEREPIDDNFESQQLLSPKLNVDDQVDEEDKNIPDSQVINYSPQKRANRIESDSSTDCEDINIVATQIIPQINQKNEDCEDETNVILNIEKNRKKSPNIDEDVLTDCEDFDENDVIKPNTVIEKDSFEDLLTQVLDDANNENKHTLSKNDGIADLATQIIIEENKIDENNQKTDISEFPTQVLDPDHPEPQKQICFEEALTQKLYSDEVVQFKVPLQSPVKKKKKTDSNLSKISDPIVNKSSDIIEILDDDDEKYYAATQELFDDLCSQKPLSPNVIAESDTSKPLRSSSTESSDIEEKVSDYVSNLTCSQIQDVVGVQKDVTVLKKVHSDGSDVAVTPKKINSFAVLETDLPNTQEIKTGISLIPNSDTESLPDLTESEIDSLSEKSTPIKVKKHKAKMTQKIRINLSDKFDPETIPVRSSSRVKKPTTKIQNCDETFKDMAEKILNPVSIKEKRSTKSSKDEHKVGKPHKSSTKDNTTTSTREKVYNAKINNSRKLDPEIYEDNKSKRSNTTKKKFDKNDQKQPKTNEMVLDKFNEETCSNDTGRKTRSKQNEEAKRKNKSELTSKTTTPDQSKPDDTSKGTKKPGTKKPSRERTKSPEMIRKSKPTKANRERSKSPEIVRESKPTRERFMSPEITKKTKPTRERSKSPEMKHVNKRKHAKETSSEIECSRKPKGRPKSSEKIVTPNTNKDITKSVVPTETEVRRSVRNRNKKTEKPINNSKTKSPIREMSAVYSTINNSPDTSSESPSRKRAAPSETEKPTAKKLKSILRATPARKCKTQYVLFTAFPCNEVKDKLEKLGAVVVSDVMACTVVLTLQIKRTFKLLCAVGLGKPIVGPNWVQACADTNMIVDPWLYLLQDEATEKRFKFNLQRTLAGKREFLKGYNVSSTPNVMPNQAVMKLIVECSGGTWQEGGSKWVCVSTPADRALWAGLRNRGAVVVSTEFILGGVLTQKLDIEKNLL